MRILIPLLLMLSIVVLVSGCGSSKQSATGTSAGDVPDWYNKPPSDPNFLYSAKTAVSTDMQMAIDKAANEGRADVARQMEDKVNSLEKRFKEEVGTGENAQYLDQFTTANKQITSNVLIGSKVKEQKFFQEGNSWRAYVLVELPLGAAKEAMLQQIKNNEQMYTRFRATQTFKELDDEVKKYDDWKEKQNNQQK